MSPKNQPRQEEPQAHFLGSDNTMMPVLERVKIRLRELRILGHPEFHSLKKGTEREWYDKEPKMPIAGSLEFADVVREVIPEEEYEVTYKTFKLNSDGTVMAIQVGSELHGRRHKVMEFRVIENFKQGKLKTTKKEKLEDEKKLRELAEKQKELVRRQHGQG